MVSRGPSDDEGRSCRRDRPRDRAARVPGAIQVTVIRESRATEFAMPKWPPLSPAGATLGACRRYHVTTFGCQMNAHDSERIKGMLEELGLGEAASQADADVLVFNTCTIREKPDQRLLRTLLRLGP